MTKPPAIPARSNPGGYAHTGSEIDPALMRVAAVVILGTFMTILDTTIVNVAINDLTKEFDASLATIQWVSTGYMLALATVIPLTGWAADRFGTKRLYIISIGLFLIGSAAAGAAWSAESLIFFRVLQGLGGGMIMPAGMTILTHQAGPQRMGRIMGLVGVPMLLGPILGPILGGFFVDEISWRWIFYVNIPVGAVALIAAQRLLAPDEPKAQHRLDWTGLLLLSPGLAVFVFGLAETASEGGFGSPTTVVPVIVGLVLVGAFVVHARRAQAPLIDIRLFERRTVAASALTTFLFGTAFFGTMFLVPLYLQVVRGESAFASGLLLIPQGVGAMIMMPIAGRLTDKTGAGRIVLVGVALVTVGMLSLSQIDEATSYWIVCTTLFVNGVGMGATMMPAMSAAMRTLRRDEVARATSGLQVVQRVGGSVGTALLAVVLTNQLSSALPGARGGESGMSALAAADPATRQQVLPLLGDAFGHTFLWSFVIIALALIPASFLPRAKPEAFAPNPVEAPTGPTAATPAAALVE